MLQNGFSGKVAVEMLEREDWVLLFIGLPGGKFYTDQVRVMKAMFLFSKEGPASVRNLYDFSPYDYGPFDAMVYRDLDTLEARGLVRASLILGTNRRVFELSTQGQQRVEQLLKGAPKDAVEALRQIKALVTSLGFIQLLKHVYDKYPDYASRSRVRP
jgi:DNA-binding PadR family transcriptional regulator